MSTDGKPRAMPGPARRRLAIIAALAALAAAAAVGTCCVRLSSPLKALSAPDFDQAFAADWARQRDLERQLEKVSAFLESRDGMFAGEVLTAAQERELLAAWGSLHDCAFALDQVRIYYEDWWRFRALGAEQSRHLRSFLLTFAAELALYEKSSRLVRLLGQNPNAAKFLDAPHGPEGIPAGSVSRFRQEFQGHRDLARVVAGQGYLRWLEKTIRGREQAGRLGCGPLWEDIERELAAVRALAGPALVTSTTASDFEPFKRAVRRGWFPAQSAVAEWMGDVRVRRVGVYLVSDAQLEALAGRLRPGDVLLARKNWYLSNVALPGFWPHAALYLGPAGELSAALDGPEVRAHLRKLAGEELSLEQYLARQFPAAWKAYGAGRDGRQLTVLEAISEGVQFSSLHEVAGDYLAALRPRLDALARAQAVIAAFGHHAKPYDFDFDFATDHALVCTELVWRSYRPAEGKRGLEFPLVEVLGRKTLPANEIARLFAAARGKPEAQLDFVAFLDGRERARTAVAATEEEFLASPRRAKWDILMK